MPICFFVIYVDINEQKGELNLSQQTDIVNTSLKHIKMSLILCGAIG